MKAITTLASDLTLENRREQTAEIGIIGLDRAFTLMLPTFASHPLIKIVAASDPLADARGRFAGE
ncbi:MAG TPA: hypothetical protein VFK01_02095 [Bradyrhizobium sp.]|nr:hypothetical protein [Bradyrhizobium sp.]